ncbi:MAG: hypothetical protein L3J62_08860 [Gammaproteobacteria bacterium]|nr:hypothetical protein [Gammaproteobacteria bacterium]MCF6230885.1 hypothetical protein [Gammaproteobacteria bacterium]
MKVFIAILIVLNGLVFYLYQQGVVEVAGNDVSTDYAVDKPLLELASERLGLPVVAPVEEITDCYEIKGLVETPIFDQLVEQLTVLGLPFASDHQQVEEAESYWVYVPAQETIGKAREIQRELVALGVNDLYVIEAGRNKNSISLGLYTQHAAALDRVAWFSTKDITVLIAPRYKTHHIYSVNLGPLSASQNEKISEIMDEQFSLLKYENNPCN